MCSVNTSELVDKIPEFKGIPVKSLYFLRIQPLHAHPAPRRPQGAVPPKEPRWGHTLPGVPSAAFASTPLPPRSPSRLPWQHGSS